jgi:hypothetical protein
MSVGYLFGGGVGTEPHGLGVNLTGATALS